MNILRFLNKVVWVICNKFGLTTFETDAGIISTYLGSVKVKSDEACFLWPSIEPANFRPPTYLSFSGPLIEMISLNWNSKTSCQSQILCASILSIYYSQRPSITEMWVIWIADKWFVNPAKYHGCDSSLDKFLRPLTAIPSRFIRNFGIIANHVYLLARYNLDFTNKRDTKTSPIEKFPFFLSS